MKPSKELLSAARSMLVIAAEQRHARMPDAPRRIEKLSTQERRKRWKETDFRTPSMMIEEERLKNVHPVMPSSGPGYSGSKGGQFRPADDPHPMAFVVIQVERAIADLDFEHAPEYDVRPDNWTGPYEGLFVAQWVNDQPGFKVFTCQGREGIVEADAQTLIDYLAEQIGTISRRDLTVVQSSIREWRRLRARHRSPHDSKAYRWRKRMKEIGLDAGSVQNAEELK